MSGRHTLPTQLREPKTLRSAEFLAGGRTVTLLPPSGIQVNRPDFGSSVRARHLDAGLPLGDMPSTVGEVAGVQTSKAEVLLHLVHDGIHLWAAGPQEVINVGNHEPKHAVFRPNQNVSSRFEGDAS